MSSFLSWPWKVLHGIIIVNFLVEIGYASWIIFVVLAPDAGSGPLGSAAAELPMDLMLRRRLYATEDWLAMGGLSLYLAITEILPRTLWAMWQKLETPGLPGSVSALQNRDEPGVAEESLR